MTKPTLLPSPDWVMELATHHAVYSAPPKKRLGVLVAYKQDRIDEEGCGPVFAAARWPLVRKRKGRHKI